MEGKQINYFSSPFKFEKIKASSPTSLPDKGSYMKFSPTLYENSYHLYENSSLCYYVNSSHLYENSSHLYVNSSHLHENNTYISKKNYILKKYISYYFKGNNKYKKYKNVFILNYRKNRYYWALLIIAPSFLNSISNFQNCIIIALLQKQKNFWISKVT